MRTAPRFWVAAWVLSALLPVSRPRSAAAETGDFYFDLTITEYKDFSPQKAVLQGSSRASTCSHYGILCAEHCHAGAFCRCCRNVYCQCCKCLLQHAASKAANSMWVPSVRQTGNITAPALHQHLPARSAASRCRYSIVSAQTRIVLVRIFPGVVFGWMSAS